MFFFRSDDGHRLAWRAAKEAKALGLSTMGPSHLLLALLHPEEDTSASRVLRATGGDFGQLKAAVAAASGNSASGESADPPRWITLDLPGHNVTARAEGLAAGLGASRVSAEHLLLAVLWSSEPRTAFLFEQMGAQRDEVWGELRRQGIAVPAAGPPSVEGESD